MCDIVRATLLHAEETYGVVRKSYCERFSPYFYSQKPRSCFLAGFAIRDPVHHGEKYCSALLH